MATDVIEPPIVDEGRDLATFGYKQQLHRKMGRFASFAAGFSFISVLTAVFQLAGLGFSFGGPAFVWTWPVVLGGQLLVALCFAELAARYPLSGAIYQWSSRLANPTFGWFAGWIMIVGQIVVMTSAAIALQVVLPQIWSGFQLIGGDPSPTTTTGVHNAILLAGILMALTTIINIIGIRLMALINNIGVVSEISGATAIIILLIAHGGRSGGVLVTTGTVSHAGYFGALLCASFTAAYVLVGFDSASEMSEETRNARRIAPRTTLRALSAAGILGFGIIVAMVLAAPSLTDGKLADEGPAYVVATVLSGTTGKILLTMVAIAICVATLAIQTAGSRMLFSMARDRRTLFHGVLSHVPQRTGTPAAAAIAIGISATAVLMLNLGPQAAFVAMESTCIIIIYLAYLMVTGAMLVKRLRGERVFNADAFDDDGRRAFSMGRAGLWLNAAAVAYGAAMFVNLIWPRQSIYDPQGGHWYLQYFPLMFTAGTIVVGAVIYAAVHGTPNTLKLRQWTLAPSVD
ncbi:amino acid permease [Mycobacterium saskatchewanense]|uniref:amino acid permease n=1 Tax=Mycobacterium saskatchewanense TaxID=220927 RepID=UPI000A152B15|nr:amino acid permease [Mycobacterium saskatchewanense]BBX62131.1 amino acid permease [Mycobacterium saskatchewanense]